MAKFMFLTQSSGTATRDGPSGTRYVINKGAPFEVKDKQDIEYFSKFPQRFGKVGLLTPKPEPSKDVDELLRKRLSSIKGLSKKNVDKLVEVYHSEENLMATLEEGNKLDQSVPMKQQELVKKNFLKDMLREEEKEKPKEEGVEYPADGAKSVVDGKNMQYNEEKKKWEEEVPTEEPEEDTSTDLVYTEDPKEDSENPVQEDVKPEEEKEE